MSPFKFSFMLLFILAILIGAVWLVIVVKLKMPGRSFGDTLPPLTSTEIILRENLGRHVTKLAGDIGERNYWKYEQLNQAAKYIRQQFRAQGYPVNLHSYTLDDKEFHNIEVEVTGRKTPEKIIIVGAHYDSVRGAIGANDNGSGVAALLELSRLLKDSQPDATLRFVAFTNEEPPFFLSRKMGSYIYAKQLRGENKNIIAMISLETIGYYSDQKNSQNYPFLLSWFYPSEGNFIAFVGNTKSRGLFETTIKIFRENVKFPSEGIAGPSVIPGISWSDQWSFWRFNYPAIMISDTAFYRYPYYHSELDTANKLDYDRLARVVKGINIVLEKLATEKQ